MSIVASDLSKNYGQFEAVKSVSFKVETGEIVGFLGPNGAGKTTTMKLLTGILKPNSGSASINGLDVVADQLEMKKAIGFLPENNPLYLDLTALEYLEYSAEISGVPRNQTSNRIAEMIDVCGLKSVYRKPIGALSKGYRQRVGLAQSLIHDPEVLILDEPTTGLDPNQILEIRELIKKVGEFKTVLLSTHILQEVEAICNRVIIINEGRLVADGTTADLERQFSGGQSSFLEFEGNLDTFQKKFISAYPDVAFSILKTDQNVHLIRFATIETDGFSRELYKFCVKNNVDVIQIYSEDSNLEDIFRKLTISAN